jgi:YD repeat-containing protein
MSHWNYRIVRYADDQGFGLHEVYYDDAGQPKSMTDKAVPFVCEVEEGPEGISAGLERALKDARGRPVFDPPASWQHNPSSPA